MKYKLTMFAYGILYLNIAMIIWACMFLDPLAAGVCVLPCCMVWLHAERIRKRQKFRYEYKLFKDKE